MAMRIITGPVNDAAGVGVQAGTVIITPLVPAGTAADGFIVQASEVAITNGAFNATVVVPGSYKFEINDAGGRRLRSFNANISGESLSDISLKEVWEGRLDPLDLPAGVMHEGASVLRLVPGGGASGQFLAQRDGGLVWSSTQQDGDMASQVYDPTGRRTDVFLRSNHVGTQPVGTIQGLQEALDASAVQWAELYYETAPNVNGQSSLHGQWVTLLFNQFGVNEIGASVAGDGTITLPAGTYAVDVDASAFGCDTNTLQLFNVTANASIRVGLNTSANNAFSIATISRLKATFTLAASTEIRVRHIAYSALGGGFGNATGNYWGDLGTPNIVNVYASVFLQRKA